MPTYLSPGVYVEEVDGGSKPIAGVGTAVAAFVGFAKKGPANQLTLVTNWTQYVEAFGDFMAGSFLAHSVYGYFNNGGGRAYIIRIGATSDGDADAGSEPVAVASLPANTSAELQTVLITALGDATDLAIEITDATPEEGADPNPELFRKSVV